MAVIRGLLDCGTDRSAKKNGHQLRGLKVIWTPPSPNSTIEQCLWQVGLSSGLASRPRRSGRQLPGDDKVRQKKRRKNFSDCCIVIINDHLIQVEYSSCNEVYILPVPRERTYVPAVSL